MSWRRASLLAAIGANPSGRRTILPGGHRFPARAGGRLSFPPGRRVRSGHPQILPAKKNCAKFPADSSVKWAPEIEHARITSLFGDRPLFNCPQARYSVDCMRTARLLLLLLLLSITLAAYPRGTGGGRSRTSTSARANKCSGCARSSKGKIARSPRAKRDFQQTHPCPATGATSGGCKGYVGDHVVPLKRGGADSPSNMQWQTKAEAKAKDKVE